MEEDRDYAPVLPYDSTFGEHFSTYDSTPYSCDRDLCHRNIAMNSGNLVKYYEYRMEEIRTIATE